MNKIRGLSIIFILLMIGTVWADIDPSKLQREDIIGDKRVTYQEWKPNTTYCLTRNITDSNADVVVMFNGSLTFVSMNYLDINTSTLHSERTLLDCEPKNYESKVSNNTIMVINQTCVGDKEITDIKTIDILKENLIGKEFIENAEAQKEKDINTIASTLKKEVKELSRKVYGEKIKRPGTIEFCFKTPTIKELVRSGNFSGKISYMAYTNDAYDVCESDNYNIALTTDEYIPKDEMKWDTFNETKEVESLTKSKETINETNVKMSVEARGMRITTDKYTTCYWFNPEQPRVCYHNFSINNTWGDTTIDTNFFDASIVTLEHKDSTSTNFTYNGNTYNINSFDPITFPNNTILNFTLVFDYPANQVDEWNLTINHINTDLTIDPEISACTNIVGGGYYNLSSDVVSYSGAYCMRVFSDNVALDCMNNRIYPDFGGVAGTIGVDMYTGFDGYTNVSLLNCKLLNFDIGVLTGGTNITINNVIINNSRFGIYVYPEHELLINNTFLDDTILPIYVSNGNVYTTYNCKDITIENTTTSYGNITFLDEQTNTNIEGYNLSELILCDSNNVTINNTKINNTLLLYNTTNVVVENLQYSLIYDSTTYRWDNSGTQSDCGLYNLIGDNTTIRNFTSNNSYYGFFFRRVNNTKVINSSFNSTKAGYGAYLQNTSNTIIANNTFIRIASVGIYFDEDYYYGYSDPNYTSEGNIVYNNFFNVSSPFTFGFAQVVGVDNTILFNTSKTTGGRITTLGTQIGGNYYGTSSRTGFSDVCGDINGDGFCDLTYTHYTDSLVSFIDYLPLSTKYGQGTFTGTTTGGGMQHGLDNDTEFYIEGQIGGCNLTYEGKCTYRIINPKPQETNITITVNGENIIMNQMSMNTASFVFASPIGTHFINASGGYIDLTIVENLPLGTTRDRVFDANIILKGNTKTETIPISLKWETSSGDSGAWLNTPIYRFSVEYPEGNPQVVPFTNLHAVILVVVGSVFAFLYVNSKVGSRKMIPYPR